MRGWLFYGALVACSSFAAFGMLRSADSGQVKTAVEAPTSAVQAPAQPPHSDDAPLIVHEWGTFTSFSGSDGAKLEFRPLTVVDLPEFVLNPASAAQMFSKRSVRAIQRMETPVTYFYTPVERDVEVRVEFPRGLLTEFYPPVKTFGPKMTAPELVSLWNKARFSDPGPIKDSMLDWGKIHLIPLESLKARVQNDHLAARIGQLVEQQMVPPAADFPHYAAARATDSAMIQRRHTATPDTNMPAVASADYFEKFLFYRGVGQFDLPLKLLSHDDGSFELTNDVDLPIRSLFLVTVDGETVQFRKYDSIAAKSRLTLEHNGEPSDVNRLAEAVVKALMDEQLYEKEARAMVAAWKSSWFGEQGTRVFYMVPRSITDELLPLHVSPTPDEIVRVLVGRLEIMSPEDERTVMELVRASLESRRQQPEQLRSQFISPVMKQLVAMGRSAEPALARALTLANGPDERLEVMLLLEALRSYEAPATAGVDTGAGAQAEPDSARSE